MGDFVVQQRSITLQPGYPGFGASIALTELDGQRVAISATRIGLVCRWDPTRGEMFGRPVDLDFRVNAVGAGKWRGKAWAILVGESPVIHVMDVVTGEDVYQIPRDSPEGHVLSLAVQDSPDGSMYAVIGDANGRLEHWDFLRDGAIHGRVVGDLREPIRAIATDPELSDLVATLSSDATGRTLRVWNTVSGQPYLAKHFTDAAIGAQRPGGGLINSALGALALGCQGDQRYLIFGDDVGALKTIELSSWARGSEPRAIRTLRGKSAAHTLARVHAARRTIVLSARYDGTIRLHDVDSGEALGHLEPRHNGFVASIACAVTGEVLTVASIGADNALQFWEGSVDQASNTGPVDAAVGAATLNIGVGWSTTYSRPGPLARLKYPNLRHAYRSPSFFADAMLAHGSTSQFVLLDEQLRVDDLDGTQSRLAEEVDVLYVCAHGESHAGDYRVDLHAADWRPFVDGIGDSGPRVVVFDTCNLVDPSDPNWPPGWAQGALGTSLRMLLGFASKATVCPGSPTLRGRVFADKLVAGDTIAEAWLNAVATTRYSGADVAIAIAVGADHVEATDILNNARLNNLPGRRKVGVPVLDARTS